MKGVPRYRADTEARRMTDLPALGRDALLGDKVETALMIKIADRARQGIPFTTNECKSMLRELCIKSNVTNNRTGRYVERQAWDRWWVRGVGVMVGGSKVAPNAKRRWHP